MSGWQLGPNHPDYGVTVERRERRERRERPAPRPYAPQGAAALAAFPRTGGNGPAPLAPGQWARHHERCVQCHQADQPHAGRGLCRRCYARAYYGGRL